VKLDTMDLPDDGRAHLMMIITGLGFGLITLMSFHSVITIELAHFRCRVACLTLCYPALTLCRVALLTLSDLVCVFQLADIMADYQDEHSTSTQAGEQLEHETAERIRLEKELRDVQVHIVDI